MFARKRSEPRTLQGGTPESITGRRVLGGSGGMRKRPDHESVCWCAQVPSVAVDRSPTAPPPEK